MSAETRSRAPELLAELADHVAHVLQGKGLSAEDAYDVGWDTADRLREAWGGSQVYIPRGISMDVIARDMELWTKFNGHNHEALAREYGVSVQWIYRRITIIYGQRQPDLFSSEEG